MKATCDCGRLAVSVPGLPAKINACDCDWCWKVGAHWGYYPEDSVTLTGAPDVWVRADRNLNFERCPDCGILVRWIGRERSFGRVGVNMRIFDRDWLKDVPVVVGR